jgi:hypothetical protein
LANFETVSVNNTWHRSVRLRRARGVLVPWRWENELRFFFFFFFEAIEEEKITVVVMMVHSSANAIQATTTSTETRTRLQGIKSRGRRENKQ